VEAILQTVALFNGLTAQQLADVVSSAHRVTRDAGRLFFEQGARADCFYVLTAGRVKITQVTPEGHQIVLRLVAPAEPFGGVAAFGGPVYPVAAEAIEPSTAFGWDGPAMSHLLSRHAALAVNVLHFVASRLRDAQDRYRELATERVEQRVAHALLRLARDAGRTIDAGVLIDMPLSREDLAEMTGTTIYTVSRLISSWEDRGLVEGGRQRIVIRRPRDLAAIAERL
jgi:CRP-like cAMP-binding protein